MAVFLVVINPEFEKSVLIGLSAVVALSLVVFLMIWRSRAKKMARWAELDEKINRARIDELEWHREKRFLMERQIREKQARLEGLIQSFAPENRHDLTIPASSLFFLAETIREERHYLGSDLSKLTLMERRLGDLGEAGVRLSDKGPRGEQWISEMSACREVIRMNRDDLKRSQNLLREALREVARIEEMVRANAIEDSGMPKAIKDLEEARSALAQLPEGLRTLAKSTGEKARSLFGESTQCFPTEAVREIWQEQMSLDFFSSKHRPGGRRVLIAAADSAISSLQRCSLRDETEENLKVSSTVSTEPEQGQPDQSGQRFERAKTTDLVSLTEVIDAEDDIPNLKPAPAELTFESNPLSNSGLEIPKPEAEATEKPVDTSLAQGTSPPSSGETGTWVTPMDFNLREEPADQEGKNAKPKESSGGLVVESSSLVIFRSADPEIWNTTCNHGENHRSVSLGEISGDASWLGIKRVDTGEEIFAQVSLDDLKGSGDGKSSGFNGSNEFFYGARHLGFFSEDCETEVETRFTYGGWGFGHLAGNIGDSDSPKQSWAWDGRQIPDDTVFEFTLYDERPEQANDEAVLKG